MKILDFVGFLSERMKVMPITNDEFDKVSLDSDTSDIATNWKKDDIVYRYEGNTPVFYKIIQKLRNEIVLIRLRNVLVSGYYNSYGGYSVKPGERDEYFSNLWLRVMDNKVHLRGDVLRLWDGKPLEGLPKD
jgi:hypothetical protein